MCGIVGYSGPNTGLDIVLEGLARLEYRGYDSAGVSLRAENKLQIFKKEGKLENLRNLLALNPINSDHVIGHTRWATHGKVNDTNAHPHGNETVSIVHNGIIENAGEIKKELMSEGYNFKSETDSEVFFVLLQSFLAQKINFEEAILKTFSKLRGNSAFVIINAEDDKIYSIKRSAPLVCGVNSIKGETLVSSDPYALIGFTDKIFFPEDEVLCIGDYHDTEKLFSFKELDGSESSRYKVQAQKTEHEVASKEHYEHFMLKEIHEQPFLVHKLLTKYFSDSGFETLKKACDIKPSFIHIVACGTAWHAGLVIKNFIEKLAGIRVNCELASEFRYRNPILKKDELALFISQSGETADTLACQELCAKVGLKTYSIVNVEGSTLFRNCDANLLIHAGQEIGVASTKAFTQQVLTGYLFASGLAGKLSKPELSTSYENFANRITSLLKREDEIKSIAESIYHQKGFLFTGRGDDYPIALEGALKLKEIAYVHAEGYAAGELKHGPISLVDEEMVNIAIVSPELYEKTYSNAQEVKARRGIILSVGDEKNTELKEFSDYFIGLDFSSGEEFIPIYANIVMQLLSYHIAKLKGTDIDKPRNLAKSVTVE